ncbi:protein TolR [Zhengella mangrovi]|uniref:Tol-Pal system protein TolR n=1 Tax=Zhengella mangrovi TaxID=1982044 RepID=A0A2G1QLP7_9HYPH|nr:protein TolR [Zhengella mangrovi]PHP66138.1 protein TolR [Zhengella mangrovi]
MGMSTGSMAGASRGRGHRRRGRRHSMMSEINVTPFVDVMLVLLIIFMVAAPLLTTGVPVDLPKTEAAPMNSENQPLVVSVDRQGKIFIQEEEIAYDNLVAKLQAIRSTGSDARIFVRGDKDIDYGTVMRVMARIQSGGFSNVGLVTLQEDNG